MDTGKVLLGALVGFAAGAVVGVLFAPHKGSVTRRKLAQKGEGYVDDLKDKFDDFVDDMTEKFETLTSQENEMTEKAKSKADAVKKDLKSHLS